VSKSSSIFVDGFVTPSGRRRTPSNLPLENKSDVSSKMEKPSSMSHQDFTALTKEQRRNLPDARDGFINVKGHPKLIIRYSQVIFKTPKHGKIHGLPINENSKIEKTEKNALILRDSLVNMPHREGILWFENGGYQKGTKRGYDSLNIYDKRNGVITVYKKQKNGEYIFSTTCELTPIEETHLLKSDGNFVMEKVLNNQKALKIIDKNTNEL
jgi:hypothetical protein